MWKFLLFVPCVFISGCLAADPKSISATPTPTMTYDGLACPQIASEDARVAEELGYLTYRQTNRRSTDAIGMVVIGVTGTGMGAADFSSQIAQLKGERDAIEQVRTRKACTQPQAPIDNSTKAKIRWRQRSSSEKGAASFG